MDPSFQFDMQVGEEVVDANRHVNNVAYVQWMQDAAIRHATATGCTEKTTALGAMWMVRTHRVEYLRPAFAGDTITVLTWVSDIRRVRSLRKYRFLRKADQTVLAEGETDWVFVDATTGRPRAIPDAIKDTLPILGQDKEP